ncbi:hypothetical protein [[Clostridium] scindens]|uniref:hypothetical protein n=1 Tax=Clostridium scindens (strain JCM 10418 / VPI 12708) TaxID=29347 RepID=UPI001FC7C112|nr:hypothetical protein [[Clostridium] scindens]
MPCNFLQFGDATFSNSRLQLSVILFYNKQIQLLFIDDFAISRYSEEGIKILYHLIKLRDDLGTSTLFNCQYSPDEWGNQLSDEKECYGKLDGIRRRLTTGFTVFIEKA